jgi:hypothetical protein
MPHDQPYLEAEKKIKEALKSGVTESKDVHQMIHPNSSYQPNKFSPLGEMPEGQRGSHGA